MTQFDQLQLDLHHLSHKQETIGDWFKYSEKLTEDFLCSQEQRSLLFQVANSKEKTLFVLNWVWPNIVNHKKHVLPNNYDTYIFFQYREPIDWNWFDNFCLDHPSQKVILLTQAGWTDNWSAHKMFDNFYLIEYQHWHYRVCRALVDYNNDYKFSWPRPARVSSLTNKPNFFKTLITAYLHKNYGTREDLLLSWNVKSSHTACGSMQGFETQFQRPTIDDLSFYYHNILKTLSIKQDNNWINDHYSINNWQNTTAYQNSAINFTNETYCPSLQHNRVYPGPFFSEKTRKALLAGCALVPIGMPNSYKQLKRFGFEFDYPWSCTFDQILGDLDRIEKLFEVIDEIMNYDMQWLQEQIKNCTEFNFNYIRSTEFIRCIQNINQQAVENYVRNN